MEVLFLWPRSEGDFHGDIIVYLQKNVPSWFPTKEVNGKWMPDVSNIPFNLEVKTINGELCG